jgi:hypothetical protein
VNLHAIAAVSVVAALAMSTGTSPNRQPPAWTLREERRLGAAPGADDDLSAIGGVAVSQSGAVYALGARGITTFAADGHVARADAGDADLLDRLQARVRRMAAGDTAFIALLADRSVLRTMSLPDASDTLPRATMRILPGPPRPDTSTRSTMLLVRASPAGEVVQGLEMLGGRWTDARVPSPYGHIASVEQPFQDDPLVATAPDGSEVVVIERFAATRPGTSTYSVARFDVRTGKRTARRYEYQPVPVTGASVDSALGRMLDSVGTGVGAQFLSGFPSRAAARAALSAVIRRPAFHTPVSGVVVGSDRSVWLREHATGDWIVHAPDGRLAGRVRLPDGASLLHADEHGVWTVADRPDGPPRSQVLVRYGTLKPTARP